MKTKLLQFVFTALFLPLAYVASAGTVSIDYVWINPNGPLCPAPQNITISVSGTTTGYNWLQDSIDVYINFGDASDTTIKVMLVDSFMNQMFYTSFQHTYQMDGIFSLQIIATAPDQVADTNAQMNAVVIGNNCGTIDGSVYNDLNGDCVYNGNDEPVSFAAVSLLLNNQIVGVSYTDTAGHYWFNAPTNYSYDVKLGNLTQYGFNPLCPSNATINVPSVPSSGNDFFVECTSGFDLQGFGYGGAVPGDTTPIHVFVQNSTCTPTSGMVKVVLGTHQTYLSAIPTPAYVLGDTVAWNFSNLSNSWNWYNYYTNDFWGTVYFKSDTLIQIGDTICNPMIITPIVGDNNPSNNTVNICIPVVSSWDPNYKAVSPLGKGAEGKIAQNLNMKYTIHFQNSGSAPAQNIYILDTLDEANLDLSTVTFLGSSHYAQMSIISGNVLKFRFDNIQLPDSASDPQGSQGWVSYSVEQKADLPNGTEIRNGSNIYFDYNPAVATNNTLNTIDISLGVTPLESNDDKLAEVFPNPAKDRIMISFEGNASGIITLVNVMGKEVWSRYASGPLTSVDVSAMPSGMYLLFISANEKVQRQKIIISH